MIKIKACKPSKSENVVNHDITVIMFNAIVEKQKALMSLLFGYQEF